MAESKLNTSVVPLNTGAIFIGGYESVVEYSSIVITIFSDTETTITGYQSLNKQLSSLVEFTGIADTQSTFIISPIILPYIYFTVRNSSVSNQTILNFSVAYKNSAFSMATSEGPTGPTGANGTNGTNGTNGAIGPTGDTGPPGSYELGAGLSVVDDKLITVGNPAIQIVSNSLFTNEGDTTIQSKIDTLSQADVLYISSGSYSENLVIDDKINIAIQGPIVFPVICEIDNLTISGTSQTVRLANMQVQGLTTIGGVGSYVFSRCVWQGTALATTVVNIGAGVANYLTFENCEFDEYCDITLKSTFGSICYFINCHFNGSPITLSQVSNQQAIFNNCAGLVAFPTNATLFGMNVLTTGESRSTSTTLDSLYMRIGGVSTSSSTNEVITTNGIGGLKLTPTGGPDSYRNVYFESGQNTVKSGTTISLYEKTGQFNVIPDIRTLYKFNFGLSHVGVGVITYNLYDTTGADVLIQSITQSTGGGHHTIPLFFSQTLATVYTLNFRLDATSAGVISTDASDYYSVEVCQIKPTEV